MICFDFGNVYKKTSNYEKITEILHMIGIRKHSACGFSIFVEFSHAKSRKKQYFYLLSDCMSKFFKIMKNISKELKRALKMLHLLILNSLLKRLSKLYQNSLIFTF